MYDKLNRLTAGYYQNPDNPYNKESTESLSYDLNGNISGLYRTSIPEFGNTTSTVIDNLEYIYDAGNQVTRINDYSQNPSGYEGGGGIIHYDLNGNMDIIPDKNINKITYNFLNLPKKVAYAGGTIGIDYLYSAGGIKLQKKSPRTECGIVNCNTFTDVTDYLDGFQYLSSISSDTGGGGDPSEMLAFSTQSSKAMEIQAYSSESMNTTTLGAKTPDLQFFPTAEGFYDYKKDLYIYQYKDHLGNVRVSFTRTSAGILEVMDNNDFYPFGMNHFGTGSAMFGAGSYKNYKYNGKELQETGMYDYGARFYMADIGRWGVVDALSEKYRRHSVYNYAVNNPIRFIDPDGNGVEDRVGSIYSSDYNRAYAWGVDHGLLSLSSLSFKPDDWYRNNKTGNYEWKDTTKEIKGYTHIGKSETLGASGNGQDRMYYLHANGSVTEKTGNAKVTLSHLEGGETMYMVSGNTITTSATSVSGLAVQGGITFAPLIAPGFTLSAGYVKDSYGNGKFYYSYGKAIGLNIGVGFDLTPIKATNNDRLFHVADFEGYGNSYSGGIGASINYGGTTDTNTTFMQNIKPNEWGKNKNGYITNGVGYGIGLDVGAAWTRTNTKFFTP